MKETKREKDADLEYVSLCKEGNCDAFEALVRRHERRMFNMAYRLIGDYDEAGECVQDAFISAHKNIKGFKGDALFATWLYAICLNHARNRLKRLRTRRYWEGRSLADPIRTDEGEMAADPPSREPSALDRLEARDVQRKVQESVNALDAEFREVIVLRDIQGFSYEEISAMLKKPVGTVKSRLSRAREAMRASLKAIMGDH
jgi:RNA polymerase sigma-70 factor, ECF subfamily